MAKLTRKLQKIFGADLVAPNNIAEFGSLKAGTAAYSTDPDDIQTAAWVLGWAAATVNNNAPALQDMNALAYLITRQLAYLFESGVPEWNAATTYYVGNIVSDGNGNLYRSTANDNLNKVVTNTSYWLKANSEGPGSLPVGSVVATFPNLTGAYACAATTAADANGFVLCGGQTIVDPLSPMNGQVVPNINNSVFLMGASTAGATGGSNSINFAHNHSVGDHYHTLNSYGGACISAPVTNTAPYSYNSATGPSFTSTHGIYENSSGNPTKWSTAADISRDSTALTGRSAGMTSTANTGNGLTTTDIRPSYISAVFVMRIR